MMENQKIKDLFAGERFGCGLGYYRITGSRSQREHNASLNRLEYKLACLLKAEDAERKAKIIAQGRALEALKAERKELRGIISEVLRDELKGQQSKNRAQEDRLEHLKALNYDLLDANDKLKRTNKALLTACDKYYEELTEARGGQEHTCNCNKNKTEDKNV